MGAQGRFQRLRLWPGGPHFSVSSSANSNASSASAIPGTGCTGRRGGEGVAERVRGGGVVVGGGFGGAFVLEGSAEEGGADGVGSRGMAEAGTLFCEIGSSLPSPPFNRSPVDTPVPTRSSATPAASRNDMRPMRKFNRNAVDGAGYET